MKKYIIPLFATPVVLTNIGRSFTKSELQLCLTDLPMEFRFKNHQSKDRYLFDTFAEELKDIKIFCENEIKQFLEDVEGVNTDLAVLRITQSWLNKTKSQEHHQYHYHPNSYLSGVLYIKCLPNDNIMFSNQSQGFYNTMLFPIKKMTAYNTKNMTQNVKEGDLILFPSRVPHGVSLNETKVNRVSLSFNTFPIGEMGEYFDATHLKL
jgi:uncharacterized protein (TIGR02466 family)